MIDFAPLTTFWKTCWTLLQVLAVVEMTALLVESIVVVPAIANDTAVIVAPCPPSRPAARVVGAWRHPRRPWAVAPPTTFAGVAAFVASLLFAAADRVSAGVVQLGGETTWEAAATPAFAVAVVVAAAAYSWPVRVYRTGVYGCLRQSWCPSKPLAVAGSVVERVAIGA
jgi:hypothetical protein